MTSISYGITWFLKFYTCFHDYSQMDSSEGQILDHREKAHSLVFLLFFAKGEKKNQC